MNEEDRAVQTINSMHISLIMLAQITKKVKPFAKFVAIIANKNAITIPQKHSKCAQYKRILTITYPSLSIYYTLKSSSFF